ncbi:MAG: hypothetical protein ACE15F_02580 [bacterium]
MEKPNPEDRFHGALWRGGAEDLACITLSLPPLLFAGANGGKACQPEEIYPAESSSDPEYPNGFHSAQGFPWLWKKRPTPQESAGAGRAQSKTWPNHTIFPDSPNLNPVSMIES